MMSSVRKIFHICVLIFLFFIQGCTLSTTKTYKAPYESIETELTNNFDIIFFDSKRGLIQINPNAEGGINHPDLKYRDLESHLSPTFYNDKKPLYIAAEYIPGKKLVATNDLNTCNIFCTGNRGLMFNIEELTKGTTSIELDYYDNEYPLYVIPIIKSGEDEEKYIHKLLFNNYEVIQQ
jgi:hypothetical protein